MIIYEILTYLIRLLGKLRAKYVRKVFWNSYIERIDRDEINRIQKGQIFLKWQGFGLECCDCGLTHLLKNWAEEDLHCIPYRPRNYKYKV